jgi:high-affinity nickel permease
VNVDPSSIDMRVFTLLGLGFVLGLRHALDADHVIAVSTLISEQRGVLRSMRIGMVWGIGHTASLAVVGLLVVGFGWQIPGALAVVAELCVGLMLVALGVRVLWKLQRGAVLHVHTHQHDARVHIHPHLHEAQSERPEHHHTVRASGKPFVVGMVHGLAGSAALMLIVLATIPTRIVGIVYIVCFGIGSIGGMALMSAVVSVPFHAAVKHRFAAGIVQAIAGVLSIVFGLVLAWEVGVEGIPLF